MLAHQGEAERRELLEVDGAAPVRVGHGEEPIQVGPRHRDAHVGEGGGELGRVDPAGPVRVEVLEHAAQAVARRGSGDCGGGGAAAVVCEEAQSAEQGSGQGAAGVGEGAEGVGGDEGEPAFEKAASFCDETPAFVEFVSVYPGRYTFGGGRVGHFGGEGNGLGEESRQFPRRSATLRDRLNVTVLTMRVAWSDRNVWNLVCSGFDPKSRRKVLINPSSLCKDRYKRSSVTTGIHSRPSRILKQYLENKSTFSATFFTSLRFTLFLSCTFEPERINLSELPAVELILECRDENNGIYA